MTGPEAQLGGYDAELSINWDASNGYNVADTVAPYLATLPPRASG